MSATVAIVLAIVLAGLSGWAIRQLQLDKHRLELAQKAATAADELARVEEVLDKLASGWRRNYSSVAKAVEGVLRSAYAEAKHHSLGARRLADAVLEYLEAIGKRAETRGNDLASELLRLAKKVRR